MIGSSENQVEAMVPPLVVMLKFWFESIAIYNAMPKSSKQLECMM